MRPRRALDFFAVSVFAGGAALIACGSFGADSLATNADAGDGGGGDAPSLDAPAPDGPTSPDAAEESSRPADVAACPASRAPLCALGACVQRRLYTPSSPGYPFAITTDAQYVYWIEQPMTDGGADAYNGIADARILRVAKAGGSTAEILATAQPLATAIAVDGGFVYWATRLSNQSTVRRVAVDCAPNGCSATDVASPSGGSVSALLRAAPGVLFAMNEDGSSLSRFLAGPAAALVPTGVAPGEYPAISVTADAVYATGRTYASVARTRIDGTSTQPMFQPIPARDGGDPGFTQSTSDCTDVWAVRGPGTNLYHVTLGGAVTPVGGPRTHGAYALRADAQFVYFAAENIGGVFAVDKASGSETQLYIGNVWSVAVDGDGVYWGEHGGTAPGALTMMVK